MCGINGFNFADARLLKKMNSAISHRGPDGSGTYSDGVSLGHLRLAIIDLSNRGKQPMFSQDKEVLITFNGEIYNFAEIRKELEEKYAFTSHTDTEVIINSYLEWGFDCVHKFDGMWAFAILDKRKNILFISRDRLGKKPLYYFCDKERFIFSSEIKAILEHPVKRELNLSAVSSYLKYRYPVGEETFFKGILKLLPGHNLIFDLKDRKISIKEYWDVMNQERNLSEKEAISLTEKLLIESVSRRKISDVPLGVILSGGLDSSLVTALLAKQQNQPVDTFTVRFNEKEFDESAYAKKVAKEYGANYHEVTLELDNFLGLMKEYNHYRDEPVGVPNEIALYLLSKEIKKQVTVVLSGEGADEIFEGYGRIFSSARDYELLRRLSKKENYKEIYRTRFSSLYNKYVGKTFNNELEHFLFLYGYFSDEDMESILKPNMKIKHNQIFERYIEKMKSVEYEKKIGYLFLKVHLPGLLNRLDSSTMASAVEARAPFLSYKLVETIFNFPSEYKTHWKKSRETLDSLNKNCDETSEDDNVSKYLLKRVSEKYLSKDIIERKKQGFPLPLKNWFEKDLIEISRNLLLEENAKIRCFIDQDKLKNWIEEKEISQKLWMLVSLELWLRHWFPNI